MGPDERNLKDTLATESALSGMLLNMSARADYGIDAPHVVRNLVGAGIIGLVALLLRRMNVWSDQSIGAIALNAAMYAGLSCLVAGLLMFTFSKWGKVASREKFLNLIPWRGDELVLDVGCGRGLFLIGAAKRVSGGRAVGIDVWQQRDQSGNHPQAAIDNARAEGVADRVQVETADMRRLPFEDATFDIVISADSVHNLDNAGERQIAVREMARVLKPHGRLLIVDIRNTSKYAAILRDVGIEAATHTKPAVSYLLTVLTLGAVRPGHVLVQKPARESRLEAES